MSLCLYLCLWCVYGNVAFLGVCICVCVCVCVCVVVRTYVLCYGMCFCVNMYLCICYLCVCVHAYVLLSVHFMVSIVVWYSVLCCIVLCHIIILHYVYYTTQHYVQFYKTVNIHSITFNIMDTIAFNSSIYFIIALFIH